MTEGGRLDPNQLPQVTAWTCSMKEIQGGESLTALTVGSRFLLECSGPQIEAWTQPPSVHFPKEEMTYSLKPLKILTSSATGALMEVTGYKPGEHAPEWVEFGEGAGRVHVTGLKWNIATVQEKPATTTQSAQNQEPQPFPPYGGIFISWPWWLWSGLASAIIFVAVVVWWRVRKKLARKRLIEKLMQTGGALSAYAQLHKELRGLLRKPPETTQEYAGILDQNFRKYISREFIVPANEWSDSAVIRDIKNRHRWIFRKAGQDVSRLLAELKRAKSSTRLTVTDCEQLHEMSRKVADQIETAKGGQA